jgi:hypothetical protein
MDRYDSKRRQDKSRSGRRPIMVGLEEHDCPDEDDQPNHDEQSVDSRVLPTGQPLWPASPEPNGLADLCAADTDDRRRQRRERFSGSGVTRPDLQDPKEAKQEPQADDNERVQETERFDPGSPPLSHLARSVNIVSGVRPRRYPSGGRC